MRRLIVAEKNNSAMRIAVVLSNGTSKRTIIEHVPVFHFMREGDEYTVVGLKGHILEFDYPKRLSRWRSVDLKQLVWATPLKKKTAKVIATVLEVVAKDADEIIIATDYDREGELIGVEALEIIRNVNTRATVKRARFSALTKVDVESAFQNLVDVDYALADSAETRGLVDLVWGATLTRFISLASNQVGWNYLSIGRVQSPTLALIVNREMEIEAFVPRPYWMVTALFNKDGHFTGEHERGRFWNPKEAEESLAKAKSVQKGRVLYYDKREERERPPVPFNTTLFLSEATKLGLSAHQAMNVAEGLYNDGYISYPRTDNTTYPPTLNLRTLLTRLQNSDFAREASEILSLPSLRPTRGRTSTTDHPPIHPVEAATRRDLKGDKWKIYELVVRRFLATLAPDCLIERSEARIDLGVELFVCDGVRIIEPGWRKYYGYSSLREAFLPSLRDGDVVDVLDVSMSQHETKPPPRYSQGTLIQEMERLGLGTKATRHEILHKLYQRKYIEGRSIRPTLTARAVIAALEEHARQITEAEMTSTLEKDMLEIAKTSKVKETVVRESQDMLQGALDVLQSHEKEIGEEIQAALREQSLVGKCKLCGGNLLIRRSKRGSRFVGCENYPKCKATHPLPQIGIVEPSEETCKECRGAMIKFIGAGGEELLCIDSECPTVIARNRVGTCQLCGGDLLIRHSSNGKRFVGCSNYPKCQKSYPLPQRGFIALTDVKCRSCGSPIIKIFSGRRKPWVLCINMECDTKKVATQRIAQ